MKKIMAILISAFLILAMSSVAMADYSIPKPPSRTKTVTFHFVGDDNPVDVPKPVSVFYGHALAKDPQDDFDAPDGWSFDGWYTKNECETPRVYQEQSQSHSHPHPQPQYEYVPFVITTQIYSDIHLYGFWTYKEPTVETNEQTKGTSDEKDEVTIWPAPVFIPAKEVPKAEAPAVTIPQKPVAPVGPKTGSGMAIASYLTFVAGTLGMA